MNNSLSDRNYLYKRHRLSHQQIDEWLGENRCKEFMSEKLERLGAVKHFLTVTDLFRENDIYFISIKGPLLSQRIYRDASVRLSHDIDFMIDAKDVESGIKLLLANGYHFAEGVVGPKNMLQMELMLKNMHHLSFQSHKGNFCVELHWVLMHEVPMSLKNQKEIINQNLTKFVFAGREFVVLNVELEFLYLLIHGAKHAWRRLKWLVDIKDYPVGEINPERFHNLVKRFKAWRIVSQTNYLLNKIFNVRLPFNEKSYIPGFFITHALQSINDDELNISNSTSEIMITQCYLWLMFPDLHYIFKISNIIFLRPGDITAVDLPNKASYYLYRPYSFLKRRVLATISFPSILRKNKLSEHP